MIFHSAGRDVNLKNSSTLIRYPPGGYDKRRLAVVVAGRVQALGDLSLGISPTLPRSLPPIIHRCEKSCGCTPRVPQ